MKIFISWSGPTSKQVAEAFREWLPNVIQKLQPWMSDSDIEKGSRWLEEIFGQLADTKFGLVCVTANNRNAPWLLFEAGALAKEVRDKTFVCPFLFDLSKAELEGPLTHFQGTVLEKGDLKKLILTINSALGEQALTPSQAGSAFEKWWPDLESRLNNVLPEAGTSKVERSDRELLEELLELVREIARDRDTNLGSRRLRDALAHTPLPMKDEASANILEALMEANLKAQKSKKE